MLQCAQNTTHDRALELYHEFKIAHSVIEFLIRSLAVI
jgi:hypothetical protein